MGNVTHVLLVEDDPPLREGLQLALRRQGYQVDAVGTGEEAVEHGTSVAPDIVVLDLMLPGIDGFEVCRRLRAKGPTPILMLTARGDDFDVVGGLEAGADDYVVKPVQPRVLDARIRAVLRRGAHAPASGAGSAGEQHDGLTIDRTSLIVTRSGQPVALTPTELRLLLELSEYPGQVLSRQQLLRTVWGYDHSGDSRLVDACVQRLRTKIEATPATPRYVQTVRGFGYRFGPL